MSPDYPSNWDSIRKDVYSRDDYRCQECGDRGGPYGSTELHAHHIVPLGSGGTNDMDNLITLCNSCHMSIHGKSTSPTAVSRNKKGRLHRDAEQGINEEVNGCPNCGEWSLSVQWYRHEFLSKAKLITCENCRTLFKETVLGEHGSATYKLREVDDVNDVPTVSSAVLYEIRKHRKLGTFFG